MNRAERRRKQREHRRQAADATVLAPQIEALIEEGLARHRAGDLDNATVAYRQALALDAENGRANYFIGIALHQTGRSEDGVSHLERAVNAEPDNASYYFDLGNLHESCGRLDHAQKALRRATELDPDLSDAHYNLGNNLLAQGRFEDAIVVYRRVLELRPDDARAHSNLGNALQSLGRVDAAQAAYERTLEINPENHAVRHMLSALRGETVAKPPPQFVSRLFDRYAPRFEGHVTKALEYSVPDRLRDSLAELLGDDFHFRRVADLGAGTGLCGISFRSCADEMVAIDLSENMLRAARSKAVYDAIVVGDIVEELDRRNDEFDLFIAADVFIYVGALEPIFAAVRRRSTDGAHFAFSIERADSVEFVLRTTGRYAHTAAYIQRLAVENGFRIALTKPVDIRKEKDGWIKGDVFVLQADGHDTQPA